MHESPDRWRERFDALTARKTHDATSAALPPYVTEIDWHDSDMLPVGNAWSRRHFDGAFYASPAPDSERPACSLVFVQSADGNTGADDPGSLGGGDTDKHLIYEGLSRVPADAVLAGAETVRGGDVLFSVWHPDLVALRASLGLPRHPVQVVATMRGIDLGDTLLANVPAIRVVLLTVASGMARLQNGLAERPWIAPLVMETADGLPEAFARLRAMGIARVSCVGGRSLARHLLDAHLVDDVYLTTAPRDGGEPGTPLMPRAWARRTILRKHGTGPEAGVVFEHVCPDEPRPLRSRA